MHCTFLPILCDNCEYVFDLTIQYDHDSSVFQSYGTQSIASQCLDRMPIATVTYGYTSSFEVDAATADYYGINVIQNAVLLYDPLGVLSNGAPNEEGFVPMIVNGLERWDSNANIVSLSPDSIGFSYGDTTMSWLDRTTNSTALIGFIRWAQHIDVLCHASFCLIVWKAIRTKLSKGICVPNRTTNMKKCTLEWVWVY
jgi:hypothetical protein